MKRSTTIFLCMMMVISVFAQKRNMLPNADFEVFNGEEYANWMFSGPGIYSTDVSLGDVPIRGNGSIHVDGDYVSGESFLRSTQIYTANYSEQYKLTFKAYSVNADAPINASLTVLWDGVEEEIFPLEPITIKQGDTPSEYSVTTKIIGLETAPTIKHTDRMWFALNLTSVPKGVIVVIDDLEMVRVDAGGEWNANIKTNGDFTYFDVDANSIPILPNYWTFGDFYKVNQAQADGKNVAEVVISSGRTDETFNCFTGSYFMWNDQTFKNWQVQFTASSTVENADAGFALNGDALVNKIPFTPFTLKREKTTYTFDWPAMENGDVNSVIWLDIDLGKGAGTVTIYDFFVIEKIDLQSLSIEMPDNVAVGQTVPVKIWAAPTNADNLVDLTVVGAASVKKENGVWYYTQNAEGTATLTATSKVNGAVKAEKSVSGSTSVNEVNDTNALLAYYDAAANSIKLNGLQGGETLQLISITGQIVLNTPAQEVIPAAQLQQGIYLLKVTGNNTTESKKIIIE